MITKNINYQEKEDYVFGLDIVRALAILFVLFGHTFQHSKIPEWLSKFGTFATIGVELFFVLSGFLIGGIIVKLLEKNKFSSLCHMVSFWKRRWMRTLPLYVIALLAFLNFDYNGAHSLFYHPEYWLFLQNFAWPIPNDFFTLSWSLAVEEHFYLWFPLVFFILHRFINKKISFWLTILVLLTTAISYRVSLPRMDFNTWNWNSRMVVLARLDSIMFGVLMAYLYFYYEKIWNQLRQLTWLWFMLVGCLFVWYYNGTYGITEYSIQIIGVTVQGLFLALLLPYFNNIRCAPKTLLQKGVMWTSKLSYSLYLGHIIIIIFINKILSYLDWFDYVYTKAYLVYPLYFLFYYLLSLVTYYSVEKPFLELRDKPISMKNIFMFIPFLCLFATLILLALRN